MASFIISNTIFNRERSLMQNNIDSVGLCYVGVPIAVKFGTFLSAIGFDIAEDKLAQYRNDKHNDPIEGVSSVDLMSVKPLQLSGDAANFAIVNINSILNRAELAMRAITLWRL
jgi:UDP-N-acetyl-D-mannosaminuronate dehydrogenase